MDWKRSVFIPIPKKGSAKECSNYHTIALISHKHTLETHFFLRISPSSLFLPSLLPSLTFSFCLTLQHSLPLTVLPRSLFLLKLSVASWMPSLILLWPCRGWVSWPCSPTEGLSSLDLWQHMDNTCPFLLFHLWLSLFSLLLRLVSSASSSSERDSRKARVETKQKEAARTQWLEEDTALMAVLGMLISVLGAAGNLWSVWISGCSVVWFPVRVETGKRGSGGE